MTSASETLAKKVALYAGAFIAVASMLGMMNKWLIAEPITRAFTEERIARQFADSVIITRINNISVSQASIVESQGDILDQRTYTRGEIDRMQHADDVEHWRIHARIDSLARRLRRR